jgi:hypothetical protein
MTSYARQQQLRHRIQAMTWVIVIGTLVTGITTLPLLHEMEAATRIFHADTAQGSTFAKWLVIVRDALHDVYGRFPFFGYATDWLAFAHIVIAMLFWGALRSPMRNRWLFSWGMIISVMIVPWALISGEVRQVPLGWRLIDCSFGVLGFFPFWITSRWCGELEKLRIAEQGP